MEKIIYNLVRNLLIVKYGFKDKFQNTSDHVFVTDSWVDIQGKERSCEYVLSFWRDEVIFKTPLKDFKLVITKEERKEKKPNKVAIRFFKQLNDFLKD